MLSIENVKRLCLWINRKKNKPIKINNKLVYKIIHIKNLKVSKSKIPKVNKSLFNKLKNTVNNNKLFKNN
jgi:hypothetical protein